MRHAGCLRGGRAGHRVRCRAVPCGSRRQCTRRIRGWQGLRGSLLCRGRGVVPHRRAQVLDYPVSMNGQAIGGVSERTLSECAARDVVNLRVAGGILAIFCAPSYHFPHELLLSWLIWRECAQQAQQLSFAACVRLGLALVEHIEQEYAEIAAGATLACL